MRTPTPMNRLNGLNTPASNEREGERGKDVARTRTAGGAVACVSGIEGARRAQLAVHAVWDTKHLAFDGCMVERMGEVERRAVEKRREEKTEGGGRRR